MALSSDVRSTVGTFIYNLFQVNLLTLNASSAVTVICRTLFVVVAIIHNIFCFKGYVAAHLVEALRYKSEGCGFDSRWCHSNFSLT